MLLLNVMMLFGPLRSAFLCGSRCFYSLVCLAKCVNVGGWRLQQALSSRKTKWEQRMEKKSIFLKAFTLIPFLYPCMCIKMYTKDGTFFWLRQVTLNCLMSHIYIHMYLMCCSIPLIFVIIIIHWDPFLFCDPKQMKMQFWHKKK